MKLSLTIMNTICTDLGGVGSHRYEIQALNEMCTLLGGVGAHRYNIDALNELCTLQGVTSGHALNIRALNALCSGSFSYECDAYESIQQGGLLNQIPAVLVDGNTVAWYDSTELSTITKDGANAISRLNDRLGSGHDLLQAIGTAQPLLTNDGVVFDGVDNIMKTGAFVYNQPEMMYLVLNHVTWDGISYLTDGISALTGMIYEDAGAGTPNITLYAGNGVATNFQLPLNTFGIVRALINGADSYIQVNETGKTTGNTGAINMGGITIGGNGDNSGSYANIILKEAIFRNVADSDDNSKSIYNYLKNKYSL